MHVPHGSLTLTLKDIVEMHVPHGSLILRYTCPVCPLWYPHFIHAVIVIFLCLDDERRKLLALAKTLVPTTRETSTSVKDAVHGPSRGEASNKRELVSIGKHLKSKWINVWGIGG